MHERRDRVERVEEKVGVQLGLEGSEPRFDQARLEVGLLDRARLRFAIVGQRVTETDDGRVDHQGPVEVLEEPALDKRGPRDQWRLASVRPEHQPHRNHARAVDDREADREQHVRARGANPMRPVEAEPVGETEDRRRQDREHIPVRRVQQEQLADFDVDRRAEVERGESISLERRKQDERRRGGEHPPQWRGPGFLHS